MPLKLSLWIRWGPNCFAVIIWWCCRCDPVRKNSASGFWSVSLMSSFSASSGQTVALYMSRRGKLYSILYIKLSSQMNYLRRLHFLFSMAPSKLQVAAYRVSCGAESKSFLTLRLWSCHDQRSARLAAFLLWFSLQRHTTTECGESGRQQSTNASVLSCERCCEVWIWADIFCILRFFCFCMPLMPFSTRKYSHVHKHTHTHASMAFNLCYPWCHACTLVLQLCYCSFKINC